MKQTRTPRQRNLRESIIVMVLVLCVHVCFKLLGWGSQDLSWSQVILVAPVSAAIYWALSSSFRKFVEEDVAPRPTPRNRRSQP
ncbi:MULTISPECIES: hypothetical protein [Brevibacterium]|uniref:Uncharacterized protein n=1 Tax=Brevibacterium sandarakinum TaxID=629680 RepID=A0A1H1MG17_BRESA|nr:hypothetical protein [Brevibacterium sandarakinum]SDR85617.1 hypothetical protein SAMN04489751_0642 [Brevibacterium sandarakinum]